MPEFRVTLDSPPDGGGDWVVTWDRERLTVRDPGGILWRDESIQSIHRSLDWEALFQKGAFLVPTGETSVKLPLPPWVLEEIRRLVATSLLADKEYRDGLKRRGAWVIPLGWLLFFVCGSLLGLYIWFATWAPPPPDWVKPFGFVIHGILLVLMGVGGAGPFIAWDAYRTLRCLRRLEWEWENRPGGLF